jgi:hypothetical protein
VLRGSQRRIFSTSKLRNTIEEADVTHVYFHCSCDRGILIDQCGTAVDDLDAARDYAAGVVRSLIVANGAKDCRDWVLHVSDDLGVEIFVVPFAFVPGKPH